MRASIYRAQLPLRSSLIRRPLAVRPSTCTHYLLSRSISATPLVRAITPFKLHDIGEGITEVSIVKWFVKPGDEVEEFGALCEVQSDKSTVELTSPTSGIVHDIQHEEGDTVAVGQVLCDIKTPEDDSLGNDLTEAQTEIVEEVEESLLQAVDPARESSGPPQALGEAAITPTYRAPAQSTPSTPTPAGSSISSSTTSVSPSQEPVSQFDSGSLVSQPEVLQTESRKVLASPAVRTLASRLGVELSSVTGTGDGGRVVEGDVTVAAHGAETRQGSASSSLSTARVEFGRTRKAMYKAMSAMGTVPHFGYSHTLNLTPLLPYLRSPQAKSASKTPYLAADIPADLARAADHSATANRPSLLTFLVKAMVLALEEHPILRARVRENGDEKWLEIVPQANIGIAVSGEALFPSPP
ncbi:hypothetical protein P7C73_g4193, partial [Tremellales sp. Uapishka_1]